MEHIKWEYYLVSFNIMVHFQKTWEFFFCCSHVSFISQFLTKAHCEIKSYFKVTQFSAHLSHIITICILSKV